MASLRTVEIDYEGMGDRYFTKQQRVMEDLRDSISTVEYDPTKACLLYTSPSPRDQRGSRMPSSA